MIPASRSNIDRLLYERDVAALPVYDPSEVAISLRSARTRTRPNETMPDNEHLLRMAQMDAYAARSAVNTRHTFDYDPCRSK